MKKIVLASIVAFLAGCTTSTAILKSKLDEKTAENIALQKRCDVLGEIVDLSDLALMGYRNATWNAGGDAHLFGKHTAAELDSLYEDYLNALDKYEQPRKK